MSSLPNNAYCIPTLNTVNHFEYERKNTSEKLQKHVVFQGNYPTHNLLRQISTEDLLSIKT